MLDMAGEGGQRAASETTRLRHVCTLAIRSSTAGQRQKYIVSNDEHAETRCYCWYEAHDL